MAVERFLRFDEEEKKRQVMGLSTFRRATELRVLLEAAESQRQAHECDAKLASRVLGTKQALQATWSEDTCRRYLLISERFSAETTSIFIKWEMKFGRKCMLDSLSTMRSAAAAAHTAEQMTTLVKTLFWEQSCKMRGALEGRTSVGGGNNATALCRAILLRQLFHQYIQQIFPKLDDILTIYGTWKWYNATYGMDQQGRVNNTDSSDSDDENKTKDESSSQTRYESKRKLQLLMDQVAKGKYDTSFVSMARATSSSLNLDLGCEGMGKLQKLVQEIWALYKSEFPDEPPQAPVLPSTDIDMSACAGVSTPAHVKASSQIETHEEYQEKLSAYQEECRQAQDESVKGHINLRVAFVSGELDAARVNQKLERVSFMMEPGRKMFIYDALCQDPMNWENATIETQFLYRSQSRHGLH